MKKLVLRKREENSTVKRINYKINYENDLNPAQYDAVMHNNGAALVIAGAGTGKTRTLIYRVARLIEDGNQPESLLLLTFTRKSAGEMLRRASLMLDGRAEKVSGGTFHSFAMSILRKKADLIGYDNAFTILDQSDIEETINLIRTQRKFDKSSRRFPRKETLSRIFNLSINRCKPVEDIIFKDFPQFKDETENINILFNDFQAYKHQYNLMDYDDMLVNLLVLLMDKPKIQDEISRRYSNIMVDEYQDTNKLQHEIVVRLADERENIMAVGDDAQSIYSFRGAEFQNIMDFPNSFKNCKIYTIEENYRSSQPILNMTNAIIEDSIIKYEKELFTSRLDGQNPYIITAENERQQSEFVVQQILELREEGISLEDMAVLIRSGYLSFDLEIELNKANIPFMKFGGMKFVETAHIKDVMAFFKLFANPRDAVSWHRVLLMLDGVGPRTAQKVIDMLIVNNFDFRKNLEFNYEAKGSSSINSLFEFLNETYSTKESISEKAEQIIRFLEPLLTKKYDDFIRRKKDLDMFVSIADKYKNLNDFLTDMAIEPPVESVVDVEEDSNEDEKLTISTIHSAKGLEWRVVFIIWVLDGRFPASKSIESLDSLEEERRLFYVACTRAKDYLYITYPMNIFDRESGSVLSKPSRFIQSITEDMAEKFLLENANFSEN
jgi:DNA helicase II / ATP-dependent DNA helicase PcrA